MLNSKKSWLITLKSIDQKNMKRHGLTLTLLNSVLLVSVIQSFPRLRLHHFALLYFKMCVANSKRYFSHVESTLLEYVCRAKKRLSDQFASYLRKSRELPYFFVGHQKEDGFTVHYPSDNLYRISTNAGYQQNSNTPAGDWCAGQSR